MASTLNDLMMSTLISQTGKSPKSPTPITGGPEFNPLGKKRPKTATPIPGVPNYPGLTAPGITRNTLLGR